MGLIKVSGGAHIVNIDLASNVVPGDVVALGNYVLICSARGFAGEKNYGADFGGAEYTGIADGAIATGDTVYWDATSNKLTKTVEGSKHIGVCVFAPTDCDDESTIMFIHAPNGSTLVIPEETD